MDEWVEVNDGNSGEGSVQYWNPHTDETCSSLPSGATAAWVKARHPTSGRSYFWNRETSKSSWSLRSSKTPKKKADEQSRPEEIPSPEPWQTSRCRFHEHITNVRGVRDRTDEINELMPGSSPSMLLELTSSVQVRALFPADFFTAARGEELSPGVVEPPVVDAGFLIVDIKPTTDAAAESLHRFTQCWWALAERSPQLATFAFLAPVVEGVAEGLNGPLRKAAEESWQKFKSEHDTMCLQTPAPLIFSAPDPLGIAQTVEVPHWRDGYGVNDAVDGTAEGGRYGATEWAEDDDWEDEDDYDYQDWSDGPRGNSSGHAAKRWRDLAELEEELCWEITGYLGDGRKDVQELAANFAVKFNAMVRNHPDSQFNPDKKNDGSFKKWLIACGFEVQTQGPQGKVAIVSAPEWWIASDAGAATNDEPRRSRRARKNRAAAPWQEEDDGHGGSGFGAFEAPHGIGSPEAENLAKEALSHLAKSGPTDMGALRQVKDFGRRFNEIFFQKHKVNNGSWKKWLISLPNVETVVDPARSPYHGNQPTMVRLRPG